MPSPAPTPPCAAFFSSPRLPLDMSLFGSIQLGANTLQVMQIGLQVTGNNIANANTPGYIRQKVIYSPAPVQRIGNLVLGLGVQIDGIVDQVDKFVLDRLVGARG